MDIVLNNEQFEQQVADEFDPNTDTFEFNGTKKGSRRKTARKAYMKARKRLARVGKSPRGRSVYNKQGRKLVGRYTRVR